jgi:ElaB/YqjD/DUF883 family membrane-anchored ribosome-binding protein
MTSGKSGSDMENNTDKATYERLEKDVAAVKNDISALTTQIVDALNALSSAVKTETRRGYKQARATADTVLSEISENGGAAVDAAQDAAHSIEATLEDAIRQRPIAAIGLAVGLGFLIGVTWRR